MIFRTYSPSFCTILVVDPSHRKGRFLHEVYPLSRTHLAYWPRNFNQLHSEVPEVVKPASPRSAALEALLIRSHEHWQQYRALKDSRGPDATPIPTPTGSPMPFSNYLSPRGGTPEPLSLASSSTELPLLAPKWMENPLLLDIPIVASVKKRRENIKKDETVTLKRIGGVLVPTMTKYRKLVELTDAEYEVTLRHPDPTKECGLLLVVGGYRAGQHVRRLGCQRFAVDLWLLQLVVVHPSSADETIVESERFLLDASSVTFAFEHKDTRSKIKEAVQRRRAYLLQDPRLTAVLSPSESYLPGLGTVLSTNVPEYNPTMTQIRRA